MHTILSRNSRGDVRAEPLTSQDKSYLWTPRGPQREEGVKSQHVSGGDREDTSVVWRPTPGGP